MGDGKGAMYDNEGGVLHVDRVKEAGMVRTMERSA